MGAKEATSPKVDPTPPSSAASAPPTTTDGSLRLDLGGADDPTSHEGITFTQIPDAPLALILCCLHVCDMLRAARTCTALFSVLVDAASMRLSRFSVAPAVHASQRFAGNMAALRFELLAWLRMVEPATLPRRTIAAALVDTLVADGAALMCFGGGQATGVCRSLPTHPEQDPPAITSTDGRIRIVEAAHKRAVVVDAAGGAWSCELAERPAAPLRRVCIGQGYSLRIVDVACGLQHCLFLSQTGKVFSRGSNASGALGRAVGDTAESLGEVSLPPESFAVSVSAGKLHSGAVLARPTAQRADGAPGSNLYLWGEGMHGQLGNGTLVRRDLPAPVDVPFTVTRASLGASHTMFVVDHGAAYACGEATNGECGIGRVDGSYPLGLSWVDAGSQRPRRGREIRNEAVSRILSVRLKLTRVEFTAADLPVDLCTDDYVAAASSFFRPVAMPDAVVSSPKRVALPAGKVVVDVRASRNHSLVLTSEGEVYTCGRGHGHGREGAAMAFVPCRIDALATRQIRIVEMASTALHSVLRSADGTLYTFGRGLEGQLAAGLPLPLTNDD